MRLAARVLAVLRDAPFMTPGRALAYARLLALFMLAGLAFDWVSTLIGHHPWGHVEGPAGKPQATDFLAFWAAGRSYWAGMVGSAYDLRALSLREHAAAIMDPGALLAFFYPPTFFYCACHSRRCPTWPGSALSWRCRWPCSSPGCGVSC
jgi:hypothetical protein